MIVKTLVSPNFSKKPRNGKNIKFIIIHYTGMQSKIESIKRLTNRRSKVSCHYIIDRAGEITQMVNLYKVAWHAGKSKWKNVKNLNKSSIGIELVNKGHKFGYQKFTDLQIKSLIYLCKFLMKKFKIKNYRVLGHSDIAPLRKDDPGEKFPWKKLNSQRIGIWYKQKGLSFKKMHDEKKQEKFFFKNLHRIGYRYFSVSKKSKKLVTKAFQKHFVQKNISGKIDQKTLKISHFVASRPI